MERAGWVNIGNYETLDRNEYGMVKIKRRRCGRTTLIRRLGGLAAEREFILSRDAALPAGLAQVDSCLDSRVDLRVEQAKLSALRLKSEIT